MYICKHTHKQILYPAAVNSVEKFIKSSFRCLCLHVCVMCDVRACVCGVRVCGMRACVCMACVCVACVHVCMACVRVCVWRACVGGMRACV